MGEEQQNKKDDKQFGVIAEVDGYDKQLVLLNLPFGRLIDEIIYPYDNNEPFFIDGVPLTKDKIKRIKIIELGSKFEQGMWHLDLGLTRGDIKKQKTYGDQYHTRFEHILRTEAIDVTAQVIKAYNQAIKPRIKNYLPNRSELIAAATKIFIEGMKLLGG